MHRISRMTISALTASGLWLMSAGLGAEPGTAALESGRMKNVVWYTPEPVAEAFAESRAEKPRTLRGGTDKNENLMLPEMELGEERPFEAVPKDDSTVLETTIEGGMTIKNETKYFVDAARMLSQGAGLSLPEDDVQILIIHTHSSEAYTQAGLDRYVASDTNRTEDTQFNIVRIGDELTDILTEYGLKVIHDRAIYDYPSYTGSYNRSGQAVEQYLESYPGIKIVLDVHRDALGSDGVVYKTMAEEDGVCASQIMLLAGSDESGLEHEGWRQNLQLALYLQNAVVSQNPTLMRPVSLVRERYNQHLTPGSLIVEVGSSGNTLQEALAAVRLFGNSVGPALAALVE